MTKRILLWIFGSIVFVEVIALGSIVYQSKVGDTGSTQLLQDAISATPSPFVETVDIQAPPSSYQFQGVPFAGQTFNNCGPATLSMVLSYLGEDISQDTLRLELRPFSNPYGGFDDKSVFVAELVASAKKHGYESLYRPNGSLEMLKFFLANDIPVITRMWLNDHEDIGHYRAPIGYDDKRQVVIYHDSYYGGNLEMSYDEFLNLWQAFNYDYMVVFPKDKKDVVDAILEDNKDEKKSWEIALKNAQNELSQDPSSIYAQFNISIAYYYLGKYEKAIKSFEKIESRLPSRMLWYQYESIDAYLRVGNTEKVFQMTQHIFSTGNGAFSELYYLRGLAYEKQGLKQEAKNQYQKAVEYNSNFKPAQEKLELL